MVITYARGQTIEGASKQLSSFGEGREGGWRYSQEEGLTLVWAYKSRHMVIVLKKRKTVAGDYETTRKAFR